MIFLITGGASGLGLEVSNVLSQNHIVFNPSHKDLSTTDNKSIDRYINMIIKNHKRIDVLINNAGIGNFGPLEYFNDNQILSIFDSNVFGYIRMIRAVIPYMKNQGNGRIINIGSLAGKYPLPFESIYSATKAAAKAISTSLKDEINEFGIKVIHYDPGAFGPTSFKRILSGKYYSVTSKKFNHEPEPIIEIAKFISHLCTMDDPKHYYWGRLLSPMEDDN